MPCCIVKLCYNNTKNSPDLSFFSLPMKNSELPEIWVERCGLDIADLNKLKNAKSVPRICEKHFLLKDIVKSAGTKKYLSKNAVPIPFLEVKPRPKSCPVKKKKQKKVRGVIPLGRPNDVTRHSLSPSVYIIKNPMLPRPNVGIDSEGLDDLVELEVNSYQPNPSLRVGMNPMYSSTYSPSTGECVSASCFRNKTDIEEKARHNYIELIEERARNHKLKRENEYLLEKINFLESIVDQNRLNISGLIDFEVKIEPEDYELS